MTRQEQSFSVMHTTLQTYVQVETMVLRVKKRERASRTKRTKVVVGSVGSEREESRRLRAAGMVAAQRREFGAER